MIIAITSTGKEMDSQTDSRFGRAKYIIFYNTEDSSFEAINNINLNALQGAGIQTGQAVIDKGANILITGNLGPKAFHVLNVGNIKVYTSPNTTVKEAVEAFENKKLSELNNPNVQGHWA